MEWRMRRLVSERALQRNSVIEAFVSREMSRAEASQALGLSVRQVSRIAEAWKLQGIQGLEHGNFGRESNFKIKPTLKRLIEELSVGKYLNFNAKHFHEKLAEIEKIEVSYSTVKRIVSAQGKFKTKRKPRRKRKYRDRYPTRGLMLQMDGSEHDWVKGKNWCLISGIDDATSEVPYGAFFETEGLDGYLGVLEEIFIRWGVPKILYVDHASWLSGTCSKVDGKGQFKRVCDDLGIILLFANSPQAKGRIERLWGTFQDRLIAELELHQIREREDATRYLNEVFLPETWNKKFIVAPKNSESSLGAKVTREVIKESLCYKYKRIVRNDETILWGNELYQLHTEFTHQLAKREVEVRIYQDGNMGVFFAGRELEVTHIKRPAGRPSKAIPHGLSQGLKTEIQLKKKTNILINTFG